MINALRVLIIPDIEVMKLSGKEEKGLENAKMLNLLIRHCTDILIESRI